jgi:hypothetical protein
LTAIEAGRRELGHHPHREPRLETIDLAGGPDGELRHAGAAGDHTAGIHIARASRGAPPAAARTDADAATARA